jgi:hypothetical protein
VGDRYWSASQSYSLSALRSEETEMKPLVLTLSIEKDGNVTIHVESADFDCTAIHGLAALVALAELLGEQTETDYKDVLEEAKRCEHVVKGLKA